MACVTRIAVIGIIVHVFVIVVNRCLIVMFVTVNTTEYGIVAAIDVTLRT